MSYSHFELVYIIVSQPPFDFQSYQNHGIIIMNKGTTKTEDKKEKETEKEEYRLTHHLLIELFNSIYCDTLLYITA